MVNIVNFETYVREREFKSTVVPFFQKLCIPFECFLSNNEAVIIIKAKSYLLLFSTFVPKNIETTLPTVQERFYDIKHSPRVSKGEWVVETVGVCETEQKALSLIENLKSQAVTDDLLTSLKFTVKNTFKNSAKN